MKKYIQKLAFLGLTAILLSSGIGKACNLSSLTLVSVTGSGPYVITVNLCIGLGITGATKGGDQRTASIFFGFWDTTPGFVVTPGGFTPAQMISPAPAQATTPPTCRMTGTITGPNTTYGTAGNLVYPMPNTAPCAGGSGTSYGCVTTTALCGAATSNCSTFVITVNQLPDSMRVFGVEGGGNPIGGCYPNQDMKIDFTGFAVEWGSVEGVRSTTGIKLKWTTLTETNVDFFAVERSSDGVNFTTIGEVTAVGNSNALVRYEFFDEAPASGQNYYRVVQVDRSGRSSDSQTIEINYFRPDGLSWGAVGPNPAADFVNVEFYSPKAQTVSLQVMDVSGRLVMVKDFDAANGGNDLRLDLAELGRGSYFVVLQSAAGKLTRKLTKL